MNQPEKITITCYGGCGRAVTIRKRKVHPASYYICNSKESGHLCAKKLPPLLPGMVRGISFNAAAHFSGYTDEWPNAETAASVIRAREILAAGIAQLAIEKAKQCN